jgi:hypothetical protein
MSLAPLLSLAYRLVGSIIKEKIRNNDMNFLPMGFINPSPN